MDAGTGLDARLLVGTENKFVVREAPAFPEALVQIENRTGLREEVWVARKDPASVLPRPDGVGVQPPPDRAVANGSDQSRATYVVPELGDAPPGKGDTKLARQFTGERLDLNDDLWGEKPGAARAAPGPLDRRDVFQRSVSARG